jgi:hypothetical protein
VKRREPEIKEKRERPLSLFVLFIRFNPLYPKKNLRERVFLSLSLSLSLSL